MHSLSRSRLILALAVAAACAFGAVRSLEGQAGGRERTLFVSAVDSRGEPVDNLGLNDFIVTEDGRRREVLRASRAIEPIDIALLIDNSAAADGSIVSIRQGVTRFVSKMADGNQIAIVGLAARPTILVDYTSDRRRLEGAIGRIFPQSDAGMTLLDAIIEVSAGLRRRETTRAVLVPIITDGVEFSNRYARDVTAAMKDASVALHAITVGMFPIVSDTERERAFVLDGGTRSTGGQRMALLSDLGINQAVDKLARELSSQYKVVYGRPESFLPPEKIEVSSGRTGVTMRGTPARGQTGA